MSYSDQARDLIEANPGLEVKELYKLVDDNSNIQRRIREQHAALHDKVKKIKKVVVISDLHCGHYTGLTPPAWQLQRLEHDITKHNKHAAVQKESWDWYSTEAEKIKNRSSNTMRSNIDLLIVNGDAIDGSGKKSGGTELITTDRYAQVAMAAECINIWNAKSIVMSLGTSYHTGNEEDWEEVLAREVKAEKIGAHDWVRVHNTTIDYKHKIGSSSVPHGRYSALGKAALWSDLWAEQELTPKAQLIIRSHVHYFAKIENRDKIAITTPALQGMGSKYGSKECEGLVDFGFIYMEISQFGIERIEAKLANLKSQVSTAYVPKSMQ